MEEQLASLIAQLRPETQPTSILWWPPSWGWQVLLAALVLGVALSWLCLRRLKQRQLDNQFIDEALAQLGLVSSRRLEARDQVQAINAILKQAALSAYPETNCAKLVGAEWLSFLDSKWQARDFQEHGELLQQRYQRAAAIDAQALQSFVATSRLWLVAQKSRKLKRLQPPAS